MLSYQHSYHAGNHADALKHVMLGEVVAAMQQKDKPLFLFDAFASRGYYDLESAEALKNREFETGIAKLWMHRKEQTPGGIMRWFDIIADCNPDGGFNRLPGSTALLAAMLREQDRLAACDLHPQEFNALRKSFRAGDKSIRNLGRRFALHHRDAYEALNALLPPKEKRGLVFLDPSYEIKEEYRQVAESVAAAYQHFASGVYVIWYPLLPAGRQFDLFASLKHSGIRKILRLELDCRDCFPNMQMHGSGMLIINPPWHAGQAMQTSLDWISKTLTGGKGRTTLGWLVPE